MGPAAFKHSRFASRGTPLNSPPTLRSRAARLLRAAAPLAGSLACTPHALAQSTIRDDGHHWTLTLPAGWTESPPSDVESLNAALTNRKLDEQVHFSRRFFNTEHPSRYILIQESSAHLAGASWDDIAKSLHASTLSTAAQNVKDATRDLIKDASLNQPTLDAAHSRFTIPARVELARGEPVQGISYGLIRSNGFTILHCYANAGDFESQAPVFEALADGFAFDPDSVFVPAPPHTQTRSPADDLARSTGRIVTYCIVGIVVVLIARRFKSKPGV